MVLTAAWLVNFGLLQSAAQRAAGLPTPTFAVIAPSVAANFLNMITKSGGMAGLAMLLADGRRRGNPRGPVVAAYLLAAAVVEMAFGATLFVAMLVVWVSDRLTSAEIVASIVFAVYLAVRVGILVVAWRSRRLVAAVVRPARAVRRLAATTAAPTERTPCGRRPPRGHVPRATAPARSLPTVAHAVGVAVLGVLTLWAVVGAVGAGHSLIVALVGYSVTVLFTIVGLLPSGVGFVEVSLGAVLVSFGADGLARGGCGALPHLPTVVAGDRRRGACPRVRRAGGDPRASTGEVSSLHRFRSLRSMEHRYLGRSGFKVSAVSYGNWITHGSQVEEEQATSCVRAALEVGITTFDTADVYAERQGGMVLGEALAGERREGLEIFTKVFWPTGPRANDRGLSASTSMSRSTGHCAG